jgi:hypothetical protein
VSRLVAVYRSTGPDHSRRRPLFFDKLNCLRSFLRAFSRVRSEREVVFVNDGPMPEDRLALMREWGRVVALPGLGNSSSYREALHLALAAPDDAIAYLAEDDYLYDDAALEKMAEAFAELPVVDYVTLYDHLDRYTRVDDARGGLSRVFIAGGHHWRTVESTCMTFGARVSRLRADAWAHRLCTIRRRPHDRPLWRLLQGQHVFFWKFPKRMVAGPVPSLATHMDALQLAPNVDWERAAAAAQRGLD